MAERPELGEALREAMAARGRDLTIAQARRLALALLSLADADLLEPAEDAGSGDPAVYNIGPANCRNKEGEAP